MTNKSNRTHTPPRVTLATVLIGTLASFGITVSGGVLALVVAGFLQWKTQLPPIVDDGLPLLILGGGMLVAGRVAVDVAGRLGMLCAVGAAVLTGAIGLQISIATEAHGDAIEPLQVLIASLLVLAVVGGAAWVIRFRRSKSNLSESLSGEADVEPLRCPGGCR